METFVTLCAFAGAWLLVAGPIYQAALELRDEEFEREHLDAVRKDLGARPRVSAWWWLLPPVKLTLEQRVGDQYRQNVLAALPAKDVEALLSFTSKANGWVLVSGGALLLAVNETFSLVHLLHWNIIVFWVGSIVMAFLCVANTAIRMSRSKTIAEQKKQA